MALVITPASPLADSYVSLVTFNAYCASVGISLVGKTDDQKEVALRLGTAYIDQTYGAAWIGYKATKEQSLCWPRIGSASNSGAMNVLYDPDGYPIDCNEIPRVVVNACCAAAAYSIQGTVLLPVATAGEVLEKRHEAGPIVTSTKFAQKGSLAPRFLGIEGALKGYVIGGVGSNTGKVIRG